MDVDVYTKLYIKDTIALVGGLRLKSEATARSINQYLQMRGHEVNESDPYTWKYYLNLNGQYHPADEPMMVISHDSYEPIQFTKENLTIHRATAKDYAIGGRFYNELRAKYPEQVSLIQGIIEPVDMDVAIESHDHKILSYPQTLVQSNETHLIPGIQLFIDNFFALRHNKDYMLFDPHYYTKLMQTACSKVFLEVLRLRQLACKTDRVHDYHVRQYLLSFSDIGSEFDYMTHYQRMWFYRNIRYLNRNVGQHRTFKTLLKKVLTDRGFSLVGYHVGHNDEHLLDELTPRVEFIQEQLNDIPPASGGGDKLVETILSDEIPLAPGNLEVYTDAITDLTQTVQDGLSGKTITKVMESDVIDRTDSDPFTISDIALNHWAYLSQYGRYSASIQLTNPGSGDIYTLSMKDAFILYLYAYNAALGIELVELPTLSANRVLREPLPTFAELRSVTDRRYVADYYITHILDSQPAMGTYLSVDAFRGFCRDVWNTLFRHRELRFFSESYLTEGSLNTLVDRCYMDIRIDLGEGTLYSEWLSTKGIDLTGLDRHGLMDVASDLLSRCTGADLSDSTSMKAVHQSMLRIMRTLSSYSVQYIPRINDSTVKVINGKMPSFGDLSMSDSIRHDLDFKTPAILKALTTEAVVKAFDVSAHLLGSRLISGADVLHIPVQCDILSTSQLLNRQQLPAHAPRVGIADLPPLYLEGVVEVDNPIELELDPIDGGEYLPVTNYQFSPDRLAAFTDRG